MALKSTKKQTSYILLLRQQCGMTARDYSRFLSEHGHDDRDRRDAGRIIGKLQDRRAEIRKGLGYG